MTQQYDRAGSTTERSSAPVWRRLWKTGPPGTVVSVLCVAGALLLAGSAAVHVHLWATGYRHIHIIGPLFLVQGIAAAILAVIIAATRRPMAALAGALFAIGTMAGLIVSVQVGLFGFQDSYSAPYATTSLIVEAIALAVLAAAVVVSLRTTGRVRAARRPGPSAATP